MSKFSSLFEKGNIGNLEIHNRIILSALEPGYADSQGNLDTKNSSAYYSLRAKGGAGLIITGNIGVTPEGRASAVQAGLWSDDHIAPFKELVDAVHEAGSKIFIQLSHAGREVHPFLDWKPVAPSAIPSVLLKSEPEELTIEGIENIVSAFALAAVRAQKAGADGVELHGAHGYLICQFLSPNMNKRQDRYGGSVHNRARFAIEVVEAIKEATGPDFPISFRLSADEFIADGIKPLMAIEYAGLLEEAGISLLSVTACNYESTNYNLPNYYLEEGCFTDLAKTLKQEVSIPVTTVGRIRTPELADTLIKEGVADFVSLGRSLVADPFFPLKAQQDKEEHIRPCLSCNKCIDSLSKGSITCAVNGSVNEEVWPVEIIPPNGKKALVAGAGPAGVTAACALAAKGYDVTVYEKEDHCGGMVNYAELPPRKSPFEEFRKWLALQLESANVQIHYNTELTADIVRSSAPDVVVVATGTNHAPAPFTVQEGTRTYTVEEAFSCPEELGPRPAIIGGGGEGSELADFISENEQEVTLFERRRKLATDIVASVRHFLLERLDEKGVKIISKFKVQQIGDGYVEGKRGTRGIDRLEGFTSIILATGLVSNTTLADTLKDEGYSVHVIGDALAPRSIMEAVEEGGKVANIIAG